MDDCPNTIDAGMIFYLLKELKEDVKAIDKKLNGNGSPGLVQRVAVLETKSDEIIKQVTELKPSSLKQQIIAGVVIAVLSVVLTFGGKTIYDMSVDKAAKNQIVATQVDKR